MLQQLSLIKNAENKSMQITNQKDFFAGLMFAAFGGFVAYLSRQYPMRAAANAGPGYFPFYLGVLLILLGTIIALRALAPKSDAEKIEGVDLRVLLLVPGSVIAFGVLLQPLGLVLTLPAVVIISSLASREFSWKDSLINATVLTALCVGVFVWALKLPFQLWPPFIA